MRIGIIGGGVYGTSIAYFLRRLGDPEVHLFERGTIASGSTGYSAGIIRHHYSNEIQIRLAKRGREIISELDEYTDNDGGFHANGYLMLAGAEQEEACRNTVRLQRGIGIDVVTVDPTELDEYFPGMNPEGVSVAAFESEAGFADPHLVTAGFARAAEELGAVVHTGTPVVDLTVRDGLVTRIHTDSDDWEIDLVVNAAGVWGPQVGEMIGVDIPIDRYESKIAMLTASTAYGPDRPTIADHASHPDMYVKPEPGGEFIVGGIDRPRIDPERGLEGVDSEHLRRIGERLEFRLPEYADAAVVDTWSGEIGVTPDSNQIVGIPRGMENFFNMVGGSGHGFKEAPAFAESVAQQLLSLEPRFDLSPYRLERFDERSEFEGISKETYGDH